MPGSWVVRSAPERLRASVEDGVSFLFANRAGMRGLAKLLIKMNMGDYKQGFHIHLRSDSSADAAEPDALTTPLDELMTTANGSVGD